MLIISCSHGKHLGYLIAGRLHKKYSNLIVNKFPDHELRIRFEVDLKNKNVVLVQSFYGNVSDCIIEIILAAKTAKELGARRVMLIAPYFPYMRQDKRFHKGEAVSQHIIADLIDKYFDAVYLMDPHLHRKNKLENVFKIKSKKLTANSLIADYIKKHIKNPVIIGPDEESYKWAKNVAEMLNVESGILKKKRYSPYHVEVKLNKKIDLKDKNVVIVDDIVSTGHTILETAKILKKLGAKNIYCICAHGIFVNDAFKKLNKAGVKVVSTNTIPNKAAKIEVSGVIASSLKQFLLNR
ncbi:ribose-phosphate diphosphokinase [Candidatus Woesearchaeota archaeon]|nr:ribose-phosphate diphosphokinase [Candidatus Woesearchaeota archaeon]